MILKIYRQVTKGKKKDVVSLILNRKKTDIDVFRYLNDIDQLLQIRVKKPDFGNLETLSQLLAARSAYYVKMTAHKYSQSSKSEKEKMNSELAVELVKMSHSHTMDLIQYFFSIKFVLLMYTAFQMLLTHIKNHPYSCSQVRENMETLPKIYALYELTQDSISLYDIGIFSTGVSQYIQEALKLSIAKIRPQIVSIIECLEIPDSALVSAIGNSYGDIYETQLSWARKSRLNKNQVLTGIKEHILPLLNGKL